MKRIILLITIVCLCFMSCAFEEPDMVSSEEISSAPTSTSEPASDSEPSSSSEASSRVTTSYNKPTSSNKGSYSKCSHPNYWEQTEGICFIGGWYDVKPGVEHRFALSALCEEEREVVYKCPTCSEPVLYELLEPLGHDFSGEEEVLIYPSTKKGGSFGKICQREMCNEKLYTVTIPKRSGNYSGIASCFKVNIKSNNQEWYSIESLDVHVIDKRTWGSVPTITFDTSSLEGKIVFANSDGSIQDCNFYVDKATLNDGYSFYCSITDDGTIDTRYGKLVLN